MATYDKSRLFSQKCAIKIYNPNPFLLKKFPNLPPPRYVNELKFSDQIECENCFNIIIALLNLPCVYEYFILAYQLEEIQAGTSFYSNRDGRIAEYFSQSIFQNREWKMPY
jgi:hypothetical protein